MAALETVSDVKDRCIASSCLASDAAEIEEAERFQTASTVLFAVGGAAAVVGLALIVVLPGDDGAKNGSGARASLSIRPGSVALSGSF